MTGTRSRTCRAVLTLALLLAGPAGARQAAAHGPTPTPTPTPDVVVTAKREEAVRKLVEALTPTGPGRQIARWMEGICAQVYGLEPAYEAGVRATVEDEARRLGLPVIASPKCGANIVIVFTPDADALTRRFVDKYRDVFYDPDRSGSAKRAIAAVLEPRPVRAITRDEDGMSDASPVINRLDTGFAQTRASTLTRTREATRREARLSYLIVDETKVGKASWRQLADYLVMLAFARPSLAASYPSDTIMSLFSGDPKAAPPAMTDGDRRFLQALYTVDPAQESRRQRTAIVDRVEHARDPKR